MNLDPYDAIPGIHYRPATTPSEKLNRRSVAAFGVPAVGYALLATTSPQALGMGLWAGLALLLLPITGGLIIHSVGEVCTTVQRLRRGFLVSFFCFVAYAMVNMAILHDRIHSGGNSMGPFIAMVITAGAYGLVAGVIGGISASLPERHEEHGW